MPFPESLGLPGHRLRVVAPDVGGSFGSKGSLYPEELLICIAARKLGRSLKWTADRLEDVSSTSQAFAEIVDAEMGFDANGVAAVLQADVIGDVGAYSIYPWTCGLEPVQVVSFLPGPYKIASYRGAVRGVATCKPPTGPYRGVGRPISTFVTERLMDLGARALGLDPLEIRRRNLVKPRNFRTGSRPASSGTRRVSSNASRPLREAAGYEQLRSRTSRCAQARTAVRHRHRHLRRADRHRIAHRGGARNADQYRLGDGENLHRLRPAPSPRLSVSPRMARGWRRRWPRSSRTISAREFEDIRVIQGDSDAGADVDRNLCEPQRGARRRRRQARVAAVAGEDQAGRLASA